MEDVFGDRLVTLIAFFVILAFIGLMRLLYGSGRTVYTGAELLLPILIFVLFFVVVIYLIKKSDW